MRDLGKMFGFPADALGHLTSSGTIANLEALWVARELHPEKAIAFGTDAHYTHSRMCAVLGVEGVATDDLEAAARSGKVGTIVVTAGTTGLGHGRRRAQRAVALRERYGVRIHVDAAYGGFFTLLDELVPVDVLPRDRRTPTASSSTRTSTACSPTAAARCCSATRASGACTSTTRPYTYFTSGDLHLGEISLECSRAGAAAAALWLTLRCARPRADPGGRRARRPRLGGRCCATPTSCACTSSPSSTSSATTRARLAVGDRRRERARARRRHDAEDPVYLSTLRVGGGRLPARRRARRRRRPHPAQRADEARARTARAVAAPEGHRSLDTVSAKRPVYSVDVPWRCSRPGPAAAPAITAREPAASIASSVV